MKLPIGEHYRQTFAKLEPELPRLRAVLGREMSDIELCFRALYAAMLYRIKGEGGKSAVSDTIEYVSPVIAELADMYGKVERGEADLFKDTAPERKPIVRHGTKADCAESHPERRRRKIYDIFGRSRKRLYICTPHCTLKQ